MDEIFDKRLRGEIRYAIERTNTDERARAGAEAILTWRADDASRTELGSLLDLSYGGARLQLAREIPNGTTVDIAAGLDDPYLSWTLLATVAWTKQQSEDEWWIGVQFEEKLGQEIISRLAVCGLINRRQDMRRKLSRKLHLRRELDGGGVTKVQLVDYSAGGVQFTSPLECEEGERVLLESPDEAGVVSVRVRWRNEHTDGYRVGCSFLDNSGYATFRKLVRLEKKSRFTAILTGDNRWIKLSSVGFAGLATAIAFAACWTFSHDDGQPRLPSDNNAVQTIQQFANDVSASTHELWRKWTGSEDKT